MAEIPNWLRPHILNEGSLQYEERQVSYCIVSRALEPRLPGFVGNPEGTCLFASEDVPVDYRDFVLWHEVRCFELGPNACCCRQALQEELERVPVKMKAAYVVYRLDFFNRLLEYYSGQSNPYTPGLTAARDYLATLIV